MFVFRLITVLNLSIKYKADINVKLILCKYSIQLYPPSPFSDVIILQNYIYLAFRLFKLILLFKFSPIFYYTYIILVIFHLLIVISMSLKPSSIKGSKI